jgi:Holliday junction resolvase RusA-like endonuclease
MIQSQFELEFTLPKPPSLNTVYAGKHYAVRQKYKREYSEHIRLAFEQIDSFSAEAFGLHIYHNTRMDCDNLILCIKFLSDYMVTNKMVPNDTRKHFRHLSIRVAEDHQDVAKDSVLVRLNLYNYESNS